MNPTYPYMMRATCNIEVGAPRNGRPGYRWVQGWVVRYGPDRESIPLRRADAVNELRLARATKERTQP